MICAPPLLRRLQRPDLLSPAWIALASTGNTSPRWQSKRCIIRHHTLQDACLTVFSFAALANCFHLFCAPHPYTPIPPIASPVNLDEPCTVRVLHRQGDARTHSNLRVLYCMYTRIHVRPPPQIPLLAWRQLPRRSREEAGREKRRRERCESARPPRVGLLGGGG